MQAPKPIYFFIEFLFLDFLTLEDGTHRLSRNISEEMPPVDAEDPRRLQNSFDKKKL
jgi:hypothetical protein